MIGVFCQTFEFHPLLYRFIFASIRKKMFLNLVLLKIIAAQALTDADLVLKAYKDMRGITALTNGCSLAGVTCSNSNVIKM